MIIVINMELFHGTSRVVVAMEFRCAYFEIETVKICGVCSGVDEASHHLGYYAL